MTSTTKIIAYYRVSTKRQGESGLGLEAQQADVIRLASDRSGEIVASYTDIETGKSRTRPALLKALAHAKRIKAILVVAKLDRLARNVAFLSQLIESKLDFVCCDNPHADRFTIHILAAVAEKEALMISTRTKAALQAAKARGVKLGSSRPGHWDGLGAKRLAGLSKATAEASRINARASRDAYSDICPLAVRMRAEGQSLRQIAQNLNQQGQTTRNGAVWTATQVMRLLDRAA